MPDRTLGPRAFLKKLGFQFNKSPDSIDRAFLRSFPHEEREQVEATWDELRSGFATIDALYALPQTRKQAALLFSHDADRYVASLKWFTEVVEQLRPHSVLEVGCGAGFLLRYLRHVFPDLRLTGIDRQENLVGLIPQDPQLNTIVGDYIPLRGSAQHDLILSDFGWDNHDIPPSTSPHSEAFIAGEGYCPGCSDDAIPHFERLFSAWSGWGTADAKLAVMGRLRDVVDIRALVLAAERCGWAVSPDCFGVHRVRNVAGQLERFPAMVLSPRNRSAEYLNLEAIVRRYAASAASGSTRPTKQRPEQWSGTGDP